MDPRGEEPLLDDRVVRGYHDVCGPYGSMLRPRTVWPGARDIGDARMFEDLTAELHDQPGEAKGVLANVKLRLIGKHDGRSSRDGILGRANSGIEAGAARGFRFSLDGVALVLRGGDDVVRARFKVTLDGVLVAESPDECQPRGLRIGVSAGSGGVELRLQSGIDEPVAHGHLCGGEPRHPRGDR